MALVSMKMEESSSEMYASKPSPYGYGLCITLTDDQCEALGILGPIKPGTNVGLTAIAMVTRAEESVEEPGEMGEGGEMGESGASTDICLTLQITDLEIKAPGVSTAAKTLYGEE